MVMAVGVDPLVAGGAAADLDPLDEAELLELLEGAVDAGSSDRWLAPAQFVIELQGSDGAVMAGQRLDDRGASAAAPVAGCSQRLQRVPSPSAVGRGLHLRRS
jgi:hypothetical protein